MAKRKSLFSSNVFLIIMSALGAGLVAAAEEITRRLLNNKKKKRRSSQKGGPARPRKKQ